MRKRLADGEFAGATTFPSETALVKRYGMSRATVRRALAELEGDGILQRRQGAGTRLTARAKNVSGKIGLLFPDSVCIDVFPIMTHAILRDGGRHGYSFLFAEIVEVEQRGLETVRLTLAGPVPVGYALMRNSPPPQSTDAWIDATKIVDLTGRREWIVPEGRWTVIRLGSVNAKYVNAPAPQEANGYLLRPWLPALFGWIVGSPNRTEAFLADWRLTNGALITKNYYGRMSELAREKGLSVHYETAFGDIIHGDLLEYWKFADAPMCEFWFPHAAHEEGFVGTYAFKSIMPCVSAAHIYGKSRVVAEAFTEWGISWKEDLQSLRDVANRHLAKGVTHLALQSYTHAPQPQALPPGGCMGGYNGTPFTRLQTWWKHMPEFTGWLRECEEKLEAGLPVSDVLWYLGDAVDHKPDDYFAFPEGFRADYLNFDVLVNRLEVANGLFAIPNGTTWRILWVPDTLFLRSATKAKLSRLATAGGRIVYGGKEELEKALVGIERDVVTQPALGNEPSEDFMWIHRKDKSVDRYFVDVLFLLNLLLRALSVSGLWLSPRILL